MKAAADRISRTALDAAIARAGERLAHLPPRLDDAMGRLIERQRGLVEGTAARLQSYRRSIDTMLERGYAMVQADGKLVTSAAQIAPGAALTLEFHDGKVAATAEGPAKPGKPSPAARKPSPSTQGTLLGLLCAVLLASLWS